MEGNNIRFMLDIESLDTALSAVVTSVCLTAFNESGETKSIQFNLSVQEQLAQGRTINDSTYIFWRNNCMDNGVPFLGMSKDPLIGIQESFEKLREFVKSFGIDRPVLWCNSPQFDLCLMNNLYSNYSVSEEENIVRCSLDRLFDYGSIRDVRTVKNYVPKEIRDSFNPTLEDKHTPEGDNLCQIRQVLYFENEYILPKQ